MTLLIASEVNQWARLVGSLPIAYSISGTAFAPLPVEARQGQEVFLTAGQSIFAVAVLASLSFSMREAILIFVLFTIQLAIPIPEVPVGFGPPSLPPARLRFSPPRRAPKHSCSPPGPLRSNGERTSRWDDSPSPGWGKRAHKLVDPSDLRRI